MALVFAPASKAQAKARVALIGPAGSGKTYTGLTIGHRLAERAGGRLAVIDTERGSASLYADLWQFDVMALANHHPQQYIDAITAADKAGYAALLIDSLSHAWMGVDGALEQVDKAAARSNSGNSFAAWRSVTPLHNRLVDTILAANLHVIVTMRSKTEWVLEEDDRGKKQPRRVGMAPVMRDGIEYEFTVSGDLSIEHRLVVTKSRCAALADAVVDRPGQPFADTLYDWLTDGRPVLERAPAPAPATKADRQDDAEIRADLAAPSNTELLRQACVALADELGLDAPQRGARKAKWGAVWRSVKEMFAVPSGVHQDEIDPASFDQMLACYIGEIKTLEGIQ